MVILTNKIQSLHITNLLIYEQSFYVIGYKSLKCYFKESNALLFKLWVFLKLFGQVFKNAIYKSCSCCNDTLKVKIKHSKKKVEVLKIFKSYLTSHKKTEELVCK